MDLEEIFGNIGFYILMGVGYGAFFMMRAIMKGITNEEIMPLWIRITTLIFIPFAAGIFTVIFSE